MPGFGGRGSTDDCCEHRWHRIAKCSSETQNNTWQRDHKQLHKNDNSDRPWPSNTQFIHVYSLYFGINALRFWTLLIFRGLSRAKVLTYLDKEPLSYPFLSFLCRALPAHLCRALLQGDGRFFRITHRCKLCSVLGRYQCQLSSLALDHSILYYICRFVYVYLHFGCAWNVYSQLLAYCYNGVGFQLP